MKVIEFEEWGNPKKKEFYDYMKSYSPYDNIRHTTYPNILLTTGLLPSAYLHAPPQPTTTNNNTDNTYVHNFTGLSDPRVQYWEPLKFTAKLRALREENGNTVLMKTKMGSGHMGEAGRYKYLQENAFE